MKPRPIFGWKPCICAPHLHRAHGALAAQAGKPILVEKPLARTLAEGRAMIATSQQAGVTLMVAKNARSMAAVRPWKRLNRTSLCAVAIIALGAPSRARIRR